MNAKHYSKLHFRVGNPDDLPFTNMFAKCP